MKVAGDLHLSYCSNIHPGESWHDTSAALRASLPRIRQILGHEGPMAVGLRLSASAAETLDAGSALDDFQTFLREGGYYVPTINGFPYGAFHGERVKERVYLPDWRDPARLAYSNRLASLLARLSEDGVEAERSVSTVPGAFKTSLGPASDMAAIATNLLRHAAYLVSLHRRSGVVVTLALEPEPACVIETIADATAFFSRYLFDEGGVGAVSRDTGVPMTVEDVRRHLGLCFDACHMAVEFEDPAEAFARLRQAGITVFKIQVSSALQLDQDDLVRPASVFGPFAEDTYLHQVVQRSGSRLCRHVDLPDALAAGACGDRSTWRVHFHVPIFLPAMRGLDTTQAYLAEVLELVKRERPSRCLEVETYTWDVLPAEYRDEDVCVAIARELSWARDRLEA